MTARHAPIDKPFLTLAEAARIAGRSYSWARDCTIDGRLERRRTSADGPILVTARSLTALLAAEPFPALRGHSEKKRPRHLRLIVDNA